MENKICSFFGHREIMITEDLKVSLFYEIEKLINNGFNIFYFGGFGDFDSLCWEITTKLKERYIHIKRIYCIADSKYLRKSKRPKWLKDENYEDIVYLDLPFDWWYKRIYFRNCEMVNCSDFIIFYVKNTENSGAYKTLQYAKKQKKKFLNLCN